MPTLEEFEVMTLEEIIDWKTMKKAEIRVLQEEYNVPNEIYRRKILGADTSEAILQVEAAAERDGRSPIAQAIYWLTEERAEDDGHRRQARLYISALEAK